MSDQFMDMLRGALVRVSEERLANATNMRLGALIDALAACDQALPLELDTGGSIGGFGSYRGYYEDLAAEPTDSPRTVADVLSMAREACGAVMTGYKGGDFPMHRDTIVWVSEYGCSTGVMLTGVKVEPDRVVIETQREPE